MARMAKKNTGWIIAQKDLGDDGCSLHHYYTKPYKTYLMGLLVPLFSATPKKIRSEPTPPQILASEWALIVVLLQIVMILLEESPVCASKIPTKSLQNQEFSCILHQISSIFGYPWMSLELLVFCDLRMGQSLDMPYFGMNIQIYHDLSQRFYAVSG